MTDNLPNKNDLPDQNNLPHQNMPLTSVGDNVSGRDTTSNTEQITAFETRVSVLHEVVDAVHDDAYPDNSQVEYGQRLKNMIEITLREVVQAPVLFAPERLLRLDERGLRSLTKMPRPLSSREMINIADAMRAERTQVYVWLPPLAGRYITLDMLDLPGFELPEVSESTGDLPDTIEVVTVTPPQRKKRTEQPSQNTPR